MMSLTVEFSVQVAPVKLKFEADRYSSSRALWISIQIFTGHRLTWLMFPSFPLATTIKIHGKYPDLATTASFSILYNLLLMNYPTIRRYIA
jgi:hypothetical protein